MDFDIIGELTNVETIAIGRRIRVLARLQRLYGKGFWRKMKGNALVRTSDGGYDLSNCTGTRLMGFARKSSSARGTSTKGRKRLPLRRRFVVCVRNDGYEASLERNKIYTVVPDRKAERDGEIRVIDESGEDYLFSADRFVKIDVPAAVRASLLEAS